jgi:hypothetical protein
VDQQEINDATIMDEMKRLIKEGHISQAERMIQESLSMMVNIILFMQSFF